MNEMVERVARAIYEDMRWDLQQRFPGPRTDGIVLPTVWEEQDEIARRPWRSRAYAAVAVMREPTAAMVQAGMNVGSAPLCDGEIRARYTPMIDAALDAQ